MRSFTPAAQAAGRATRSRLRAERASRIVELVGRGLTTPEIAAELRCSLGTVHQARQAAGVAARSGGDHRQRGQGGG